MGIYALYRGEKCLSIGTVEEIAKDLNIKVRTVEYYGTGAYKRKVAKSKNGKFENQRALVKVS